MDDIVVDLATYREKRTAPEMGEIVCQLRRKYGSDYRWPAGEPPLDEIEQRVWQKYGHVPWRLESEAWLAKFWSLAAEE